jgi:uncharacterized transporter YbjL
MRRRSINVSKTEAPTVIYAGVCPAAMIVKIIVAQLLLSALATYYF